MAYEGRELELSRHARVIGEELESILEAIEEFINTREGTIKSLKAIVEDMKFCSKGARIAKIAGAGFGAAAGVLAGVCLVAAPFTGGLSLFGLAGGAAIGAVGALTGVGAHIGETVDNHLKFKSAEELLDKDNKRAKNLQYKINGFHATLSELEKTTKFKITPEEMIKAVEGYYRFNRAGAGAVAIGAKVAPKMLKPILQAGKLGEVLEVVAVAGKVARVAGAVIAVALVPFDIYNIVTNAIDLAEGKLSEKADIVDKTRKELEENLKRWKDLINTR